MNHLTRCPALFKLLSLIILMCIGCKPSSSNSVSEKPSSQSSAPSGGVSVTTNSNPSPTPTPTPLPSYTPLPLPTPSPSPIIPSPQPTASVTCTPSLNGSKMVGINSNLATSKLLSSRYTSIQLRSLKGNIPQRLKRYQDIGKSDERQELPITVSLQLNHESELEQELINIYTPGNPKFHKFLSSDEFASRFGQNQDQINQVMMFLQNSGFHSISINKNHLLIHAVGSVKVINSTLRTELRRFVDSKGSTFRAPANDPFIPENLPIQGIHGLHNLTMAHTHSIQKKGATGPAGGFSPTDIRKAYNIPNNLDGSGQSMALFELDGYSASDISAYEKRFNLPATPLKNVMVDYATGNPGLGAGEVTLDIELMIAVAPRASQILVYEGPNSDQGILDTYGRIANDNIAKSISTSWGSSEAEVTSAFMKAENTIFAQMAAQGQTIYSAAGDTGSDDNGYTLTVDDPSSNPYVVAVGGTTLTTSSTGSYLSETTWNNSTGASGGGISAVWSIPSWQKNTAFSSAKASSSMRNIPDVAFNSDIETGYSIYFSGSWGTWGGTSCAAPLWAAFNALLNQLRANNNLSPIGFITPALYAIGASNAYHSDFFDIKDYSTNGYYPAVQGLDNATGWGSFNGNNLLNDLILDQSIPSSSCSAD